MFEIFIFNRYVVCMILLEFCFRALSCLKLDIMFYFFFQKFWWFFFVFGFSELVDSCRDLMHIVFVHYLEVKVMYFFIVIASFVAFIVIAISVLNLSY